MQKFIHVKKIGKWLVAATLLFVFPKQGQNELSAMSVSAYSDEGNTLYASLKQQMNAKLVRVLENKLPSFLPKAKSTIITIIDFSLPSTSKRLWTIDIATGSVLFHSHVAHGRNTGENIPQTFSNKLSSYQSSLGFYVTEKPYIGKHGKSLRLQGLEKDINDKAFERAIVVHGADYVSEEFIEKYGRLGRSLGCPALPREITEEFIETVQEGSLLFIYHPQYEEVAI